MATAFTEQEKRIILVKLRQTAKTFAATIGVRKTSVDQLAQAAGISKGAFYKFYDTKELLFFEVLENLHAEIYQQVAMVLGQRGDLCPADRAAEAILTACRLLEQNAMVGFVERDLPYLLRKVPQEIQRQQYHSDEVHIQQLIELAGFVPESSQPLVAATIRSILVLLAHRQEIGEQYPLVLECLVRGACRQLFPPLGSVGA